MHVGDAVATLALQQGLGKALCCCLHTAGHCGMLLLQEMEQRQDQKGAKELEKEPERVALLPLLLS